MDTEKLGKSGETFDTVLCSRNIHENLEYFKEFFQDGGQYQRYIQFVNNGIPDAGDVIKVGKEYKVGAKVLVNKDALRKCMEDAGIIKGLGGMF